MRIAFDTNILLYCEGVDGPEKQRRAKAIVDAVPAVQSSLPIQVCAELFRALVTKVRLKREAALNVVDTWRASTPVVQLSLDGFSDALSLAALHQLQIFDAMILVTAAEARCSVLLSEDMQHGFTWRGCTVVDPFAEPVHPALAAIIARG